MSQSEEGPGAEEGPDQDQEGDGAGGDEGDRGREVAMETPSGPVYCVCRRPDINCFMM